MRLESSGVCANFWTQRLRKNHTAQSISRPTADPRTNPFQRSMLARSKHSPACIPARSRICISRQSLFPHLNVAGNLHFARQRAAQGSIDYQDVIDTLGVQPLLSRTITGLSGGEAKRVAIARALVSQPQLLLMDEPLNGLDQISKREILGYLRRLNRHFSLPTLYVSHDIEEVARLCDHMLVMNAGRVIDQGRTASIIEKLNQNPDQAVSPVGSVIHAKSEWPSNRLFAD